MSGINTSEMRATEAHRITKGVIVSHYCLNRCRQPCKLRFGVYLATYKKIFTGRLLYTLFIDGKEAVKGEWTNIGDNTTNYVAFDGHCAGVIALELKCESGTVGIWKTDSSSGATLAVHGNYFGRACYKLECGECIPAIINEPKDVPKKVAVIEPKDEPKEMAPISLVLPSYSILGMVKTMNIHGGVRRYFELGNAFNDRGHNYSLTAVHTKEKQPWVPFKGKAAYYEEWLNSHYDIVFTGAYECFQDLIAQKSKHRVVFVVAKFYADKYLKLWKRYGNSLKWIGVAKDWNKGMEEIQGVCIPGGVNTGFFTPNFTKEREKLTVAFYARTGLGRGVERILKVVKNVPEVNFIGFDAPGYDVVKDNFSNLKVVMTASQVELRDVMQGADIVMSAMDAAGWNNVISEGAACGCVPIATEAGTRDVILHERTGFLCSNDKFVDEAVGYLKFLAANYKVRDMIGRRAACWVQQFDWGIVSEKILAEVVR